MVQGGQATRFHPGPDAPRVARGALRRLLAEHGIEPSGELSDDAILLASELFDNAVLHAGTAFELEVRADSEELFIGVRDHGDGPLELYLSEPRQRYGRAATHGRGLLLMQRVADSWGTRHDSDGSHQVWFTLRRGRGEHRGPARATASPAESDRCVDAKSFTQGWAEADELRWLLRVPAHPGGGLELTALIAELVRRLRELIGVPGIAVEADGGGGGFGQLACDGLDPTELPADRVLDVGLPLSPPLRGTLRLAAPLGSRPGQFPVPPLAEVAAQRIALAVESDWLRRAERRRQTWLAYLADTSELLGQSLDVELTAAVIPHVAVPRLGSWCAVYLPDVSGKPRLAALSHRDEPAMAELRTALEDRSGSPAAEQMRSRVVELLRDGTAPTWFQLPTDGVAVPMTAAGRPVGVLAVGRCADRAHSPEDVMIIADIARRAALAIDNAQRAELHSATSRALQQALLPRALPITAGIEFAAAYLPGGTLTEVGGDFYDVVPVATGGWLAAIGDVCGKGARTAARTSLVRDVLRVLYRDRGSLLSTISSLNEVMLEAADPAQFCTLAAAVLYRTADRTPSAEPAQLNVELVLAGHPQPVLLRAGGGAELVGRFGTAIGLIDRIELTRTTHALAAGDTLLFYTDGVTERRRGRDQFGSERLLEVTATCAGMSAERTVSSVRAAVESFSRNERRDDIALLAVRATTLVSG